MKTAPLNTSLVLVTLLLCACSKHAEKHAASSPAPIAQMPKLATDTDSTAPADAAPAPAPDAAAPSTDTASIATESPNLHLNDLERLTYALRLYYGDPNRAAINSLEPLVSERLIRSIPSAPSGQKYVIDLAKCEVRLERL